MRKFVVLLACVMIALPSLVLAQDKVGGGLKKRVAVMDFEDKTGHGSWQLGSGMADKLTTALVKSGRFVVIEREQLKKLMQEQALGMSGAVSAGTAATVGRLAGVELMVTGSVNEFGQKKGSISAGGGGGRFGGLRGIGVETKTARVGCSVRMVNTSTGEIVAAEDIAEEESKKGVEVSTNEFDFANTSSFDNTLAGKAMAKSINKAIDLIAKAMDKLPWTGRVLKDNGDGTIMLRPGTDGGVKVGDSFTIYNLGDKITDPTTGEELGQAETKAGTVSVTAVQEKFSTGKVTGKGGKPGDAVRLQ